MHARQGVMKSIEFGDYLNQICPAIEKDQSDSGSIVNVIEFFVQCGYGSLPQYYIIFFLIYIIL
jgi:glutamate synthase (NADH)